MSDDDDGVDGLENVVSAVERVERAVKDKWSTAQVVGWCLVGFYVWSAPGQIWHAQWRYAFSYGLDSSKVHISDKPHDCAFFAAPLGEKYCHYERRVSTLRWATSTTGNPIASFDDGKTWSTFTPDTNDKVPQYSTVEAVYVSWQKKDD